MYLRRCEQREVFAVLSEVRFFAAVSEVKVFGALSEVS